MEYFYGQRIDEVTILFARPDVGYVTSMPSPYEGFIPYHCKLNLKVNEKIPVWVVGQHRNSYRVALQAQAFIKFESLKLGQRYYGRVINVINSGVFVAIGASKAGFIRAENLAGQVQQDIFQRGNLVHVQIAALREQKEEIDFVLSPS